MKQIRAVRPRIRIAVLESDSLRLVGYRVLCNHQPDLEILASTIPRLSSLRADLVLLGSRNGENLFETIASLKAARPDLKIIATGSAAKDETILKALAAGAKGYIDEAGTPQEFVQAIHLVQEGSVWAPRHILSMFVERVTTSPGRIFPARVTITEREKDVLVLLVASRSNKEIGSALGIRERTVKAHVSKLLRKLGVENRTSLSVHAITHNFVTLQ